MTIDLSATLEAVEVALNSAKSEVGPWDGRSQDYWIRNRHVMSQLADRLKLEHGATVAEDCHKFRVRIAGCAATSTSSLEGAVYNWTVAARKRLAG